MTTLLLFTRTTGYRHEEAIDLGIDLIQRTAAENDVDVIATEDPAAFEAEALEGIDAAVWLHVSGDVLEPSQREAFGTFLRQGGGFAGIHGAADAEWGWPEYEQIIGARFLYHPKDGAQTTDLIVETHDHPSTRTLPDRWRWTEEWYSFQRSPRPEVDVLLSVDESTYDLTFDETIYDPAAPAMGADHPISWAGRFGAGHTWFTSLGHHPEAYADENFTAHIWGGITSVL